MAKKWTVLGKKEIRLLTINITLDNLTAETHELIREIKKDNNIETFPILCFKAREKVTENIKKIYQLRAERNQLNKAA